MGSEREDTDPTAAKGGTEPGLGPPSSKPNGAAATPEPPPPVDFDALHAALGPIEEPVTARRRQGTEPVDATKDRVGDSQGRSSAQYASARPHTIPPTRAPEEPPDIPAVIVADDTVPSAPPAMTAPVGAGQRAPASGPHAPLPPPPGTASTTQPSYPHTPQPFAVERLPPQLTVRMPDRPHRPRNPTVVVRRRGPSTLQKLAAFVGMLLLVVTAGVAFFVMKYPWWFGLDRPGVAPADSAPVGPGPSATASMIASALAPPSSTATPPGSATSTATTTTSAKPAAPRVVPKLPPTHTAPH
jgi:hypothetical protein